MGENEELCLICGDLLYNNTAVHKQSCGHTYHYECLLLSYKSMKRSKCPYCANQEKLPIISGVKKVIPWIHDLGTLDPELLYDNTRCGGIIKSGEKKGQQCSRHCYLGSTFCKTHHKINIQLLDESNNKG